MGASDTLFQPLPQADVGSDLQTVFARPVSARGSTALPSPGGAVSTARLYGFDLQDSPVLIGLGQFPGELVTARSTVALRRAMVGAEVLVLFKDGDWNCPIVVGVLQDTYRASAAPATVDVQVDDECLVLSAEREIVLRCGDASITLTRAGKVLLQGRHIISRSSGTNKIKGATVDIN